MHWTDSAKSAHKNPHPQEQIQLLVLILQETKKFT